MESNLSNVPEDLGTADERFCSVIQAQVSIRCIYAVDIVFETIVFFGNVGILPGGEERDIASQSPICRWHSRRFIKGKWCLRKRRDSARSHGPICAILCVVPVRFRIICYFQALSELAKEQKKADEQ